MQIDVGSGRSSSSLSLKNSIGIICGINISFSIVFSIRLTIVCKSLEKFSLISTNVGKFVIVNRKNLTKQSNPYLSNQYCSILDPKTYSTMQNHNSFPQHL
ncbi:hypothetical protein DERP_006364 [Dermatophagoides pteronyssinus]|uniref:Uncharacterized protein n=1 Tax=Dermatophagoides pteronyssinus TaxID=6956 RepID=A0ABQ8IYC7_DERPT|nr:hypothetical protein DERP_006364 [Dermatophagoides pteronyssinus]